MHLPSLSRRERGLATAFLFLLFVAVACPAFTGAEAGASGLHGGAGRTARVAGAASHRPTNTAAQSGRGRCEGLTSPRGTFA